jgi:hypothetical protein
MKTIPTFKFVFQHAHLALSNQDHRAMLALKAASAAFLLRFALIAQLAPISIKVNANILALLEHILLIQLVRVALCHFALNALLLAEFRHASVVIRQQAPS